MKQPRSPSASPFPDRVTPPVEVFALDDRVTHDRYGLGSIVGVERDIAVLVDFSSEQVRITSPFTKLTKL
ncbi:MAG: hypothetical protein WBC76_12205 [Actinomycetes bacterium]